MIFDAFIAISLVLAFIRGWRKGLLWAVASLVAVVIASMVSMKLSHHLAAYLQNEGIFQSQFTLVVSYILLFLLVMLAFRFVIKGIEKIMKTVMLGWANRLGGGLLYVFFTAFMLSTVLLLGKQLNITGPEAQNQSSLYAYIEPIAPIGMELGGEILPVLKSLYSDINNYLDTVAEN